MVNPRVSLPKIDSWAVGAAIWERYWRLLAIGEDQCWTIMAAGAGTPPSTEALASPGQPVIPRNRNLLLVWTGEGAAPILQACELLFPFPTRSLRATSGSPMSLSSNRLAIFNSTTFVFLKSREQLLWVGRNMIVSHKLTKSFMRHVRVLLLGF